MGYDEAHINESSCFSIHCEESNLEDEILNECHSEDMNHYMGLAKIPVVIGEVTVQFDIEAKIKLPEPALEIKRIKKNVFLTQCRLIAHTNKVFLGGFVRKNIEYATIDCITEKAICGDIKHCTVRVPFQCTAEVKCLKPADFFPNSPVKQITYFDEKNLGIDVEEKDFISSETFNEKVYCELKKSSIYEADIIQDAKPIPCHPMEQEFQIFIEKEVVCLTLSLLQNQQIGKAYKDYNDCECDC